MKTTTDETMKIAKNLVRIALSDQAQQTLKHWRTQIGEVFPEFEPSDRELICWAIEHLSVLSPKGIQEIKLKYFDEFIELQSIVRKLKVARADGDTKMAANLMAKVSFHRKRNWKSSAAECSQPLKGAINEG